LKSPVNPGFLSKNLEKLIKTIKDAAKTVSKETLNDLVSLIYHLKIKYMNTSIANDVETAMTDLVDSLQYDQAKIDNKKYSIHPWGTDESTESSENFDLK
jgi:hypothetical protein